MSKVYTAKAQLIQAVDLWKLRLETSMDKLIYNLLI